MAKEQVKGSLVATTDVSGNVTGTNVLSPYGETLSSNTNDSYSYAGLTQDTEYGGDAASFRNYSTEQTRWLRPDPYDGSYDLANPQSFNRYMYVSGNPLMYTDPSGEDFGFICGPGCVGVVGEIPMITPITAIVTGVLDLIEMGEVLGWWGGPPQFNGNVHASQTGKNVPQAQGVVNPKNPYVFHVDVFGTSLDICAENPTLCAAGTDALNLLESIPSVATSAMLLNMQGDNSVSEEACRREWAQARDYCSTLMTNPSRAPNVWGGSFDKCVRGQVSQACGGNRVN